MKVNKEKIAAVREAIQASADSLDDQTVLEVIGAAVEVTEAPYAVFSAVYASFWKHKNEREALSSKILEAKRVLSELVHQDEVLIDCMKAQAGWLNQNNPDSEEDYFRSIGVKGD